MKKLYDSGFSDWDPSKLNNLSNKRFFITGGNSGIGLEAAKILSSKGANIIIGSRDLEKARVAVGIIKQNATADVDFVLVDLASNESVKKCAQEIRSRFDSLDGLINNAGVMQTPQSKTIDGFELQFATNHLGHFLLNSLLFDLVEKAAGRIVVVSSIAHKFGKINFEDLMNEDNYDPSKVYFQSKLANLMYALELDRRLKASGSPVAVVACHPGYSGTNLQSTGPVGALKFIYKITNKYLSQPAMNGAFPTVLAAAGEEAIAGAYYGPQGFGECRGRVSDAIVAKHARDIDVAALLWQKSEELLGLSWPIVD